MKRLLITGASGFLGTNAVPLLLQRGYEIHAVAPESEPYEVPGVQRHGVDLLDASATACLLAKLRPSHLLHLAWYVEPGKFWQSSLNFLWVEASLALLRHFRTNGGQRAVFAGTCAEYDWSFGYCSELVTPCRPATPYGFCKHALQELLAACSAADGLSSAWGRIFFLYGPNEHPSRLVSSVATTLLRGETARCTHGQQLRDFLHVEDVASAFVELLDSEVTGAVNIASGRPVSIRELVLTVADQVGMGRMVDFGALAAGVDDPPLLVGDNRRLTTEVGWTPKYDLVSGVAHTVDWWKKRG